MELYTKITQLNDFIFCPRSLYFHELYGNTTTEFYHTTFQRNGRAAHRTVDNKSYSTRKDVLHGVDVYCEQFKLQGKIDLFDIHKQQLTERKKKIRQIYDGYIFQLYAQYFGLIEMGYQIKTIRLYSMDDNKVYPVKKPHADPEMFDKFCQTVEDLRLFDLNKPFHPNPTKCKNCVYCELCDVAAVDNNGGQHA